MKKMKTIWIGLIMLLVACSPKENQGNIFRVGMEANYAPYNWTQTQGGNEEIISQRSKTFKKLDIVLDELPLSQLLNLIHKNPTLLRRPILMDEKKLQVGFNEDEIRRFLPRSVRVLDLLAAQRAI